MEIEFIRIISRRKIFTILVSTKLYNHSLNQILETSIEKISFMLRRFYIVHFVSKETSPTSIESKKRSSVKLVQTVTLRPISKHLVESKSYPCNNTILQLIIHEVNRRGRDWPHSSSRIAPLFSVLLTNPLSMRIPSRGNRDPVSILPIQPIRSDPIRSVRLLANLHTTVSDLPQFPSIARKKMWSVLTPWDFQSPKNKSLDIVMLIRRVRLNARSTASVELEKDVVPFSPELLHKIMCVCVCNRVILHRNPSALVHAPRTPRSNVCGRAAATCLTLRTREPHCDFNRRLSRSA